MIIGGSSSNFRCCELEPSAAGGLGVAMVRSLGLMDRDRDDALGDVGGDARRRTLLVDGVHDVGAGGDLPEESVRVGQALALGTGHDEELTSTRMGLAGVRHGY